GERLCAAAEAGGAPAGGIKALVHSVLPKGGAMVTPILTRVGGKLVIVTAADGNAVITVLDLPNLTTETLDVLLRSWFNAYNVQYLPQKEQGETRFALVDKAVATAKALRALLPRDNSATARPFAHPVYWGGFVYTGQ